MIVDTSRRPVSATWGDRKPLLVLVTCSIALALRAELLPAFICAVSLRPTIRLTAYKNRFLFFIPQIVFSVNQSVRIGGPLEDERANGYVIYRA